MRLTAIALAGLSAVACAVAEPAETTAQPHARPVGECAMTVRFGSYASGIDTPAVEAVAAVLRADARAGGIEVRPWGREGERDLCLTPRAADDGPALVKVARSAIPARKLNGYVEILLNGKRVFTSQTPD